MDFPNIRTFIGAEGVEIFCRYSKPTLQQGELPRAVVFMCHGLFEYGGTDSLAVEKLTEAGFFVCGHDHSGHGKSGGDPGQVHNVQYYVQDVITHVRYLKESFPNRPFFLFGHSMGGAVAILVGLQEPELFRGIVLVGPLVIANPAMATWTKRMAAKILSKIVPRLGLEFLNNDDISRDKAIVDRFNSDPLVYHDKISVQTGHALLEAVDIIGQNFENVRFPFLCIHGGGDKLCEQQGAQDLLDKSSSTDKTLSIYPGAFHRVQDEPDGVREKCMSEIIAWISERS